jgi:hypothetical protein
MADLDVRTQYTSVFFFRDILLEHTLADHPPIGYVWGMG